MKDYKKRWAYLRQDLVETALKFEDETEFSKDVLRSIIATVEGVIKVIDNIDKLSPEDLEKVINYKAKEKINGSYH